MPDIIWIVYAIPEGGSMFPVAGYAEQEQADAHALRCNSPMFVDDRDTPSLTPAEVVGVKVIVRPLKVQK